MAPTTHVGEFLDKVCLAASSPEHGCTNCPTWELEVDGQLDPDHLRTALGWLIQRYWPIRSQLEPTRRPHFRIFDELDPREILEVVDTDLDGLVEVQGRVRDLHLDLTQILPLQLTLVRIGADL